jgi:hypothetical protein
MSGGRDVSWTDSFSLSSVGLHPLNYVRDEESGSYHDDSDSDSDGDELNDDSSAFDGDDPYHESFGQDIVDGLADEDDSDDADEHHVPRDFDNSAKRGMYLLAKTMK